MKITVLVIMVLTIILTIVAYIKDPHLPVEGLKDGWKLFRDIFPSLIFAFILAGMIGKVLPQDSMKQLLGEESGMRGLITATVAGAITPGGPFVQFPIVAALLKSGAGVAPLMTYISAWLLLGFNRVLVYEINILGWKLASFRFAISLIFPIIIGLLTRILWVRLN